MKTCPHCNKSKPFLFTLPNPTNPDDVQSYCEDCLNAIISGAKKSPQLN